MGRTRIDFSGVIAVAAAALGVACAGSTSPLAPASSTSAGMTASASAAGPSKAAYGLTFTNDIQSGPLGPIALNLTNPWKGISLNNATLTFPAAPTTGTGCEGTGTNSWGGNAGTWTGALTIQQKGGLSHLGFQANVIVGGQSYFFNLAVNHKATASGPDSTGAYTLDFVNARAYMGASSPDPAADPCVNFTVTAKR